MTTTNLSIITDTSDRDLVTVYVIHDSGILGNKEERMIRQTITRETLHYAGKSPKEALAKLAGELCTKLLVMLARGISDPLQRLERAQKVLLWRDRECCTWKWISKMIGKPPGACKAMYRMAVRIRSAVGGSRNDTDVVAAVRRWLNRHYNVAGKITDKRQWIWHSQVKELAEMIGAKTFKVNGRIYVDWMERGQPEMVPVMRWEQQTMTML